MAFACKDPSVTYLNRYGYNVVKLPRTGIEPLDVLGRDKGLHPIGSLSTVWKTEAAPPRPGTPSRAGDIEGQRTDKLDLSIGLQILANALAAFGASTPSLEFAYHTAKKVQFTLTNVFVVGIDPLVVGEYLAEGDLNLNNPVAARYFNDDETSAFIITEVLKSDSIAVTATDSRGTEVKVDVPAISQVVGAKVGVKPGTEGSSAITYKGPELITFGFKAFEIEYGEGHWRMKGVNASGNFAFADAHADGAVGVLFNPGGVVRV